MADAMTREKLSQEISMELSNLRNFTDLATKLLGDITATANRGDVTFTTLEQTKQILGSITEYKASISNIRNALKARMTQRTKEV